MSQTSNRILIVTGANGSGKSIFLQQVGIIVYLAHIGCFVPAESATIGLVDAIFARTAQDGERMETFVHDLTHLGNMLRYASDRSLVLMDEVGKVRVLSDITRNITHGILYAIPLCTRELVGRLVAGDPPSGRCIVADFLPFPFQSVCMDTQNYLRDTLS